MIQLLGEFPQSVGGLLRPLEERQKEVGWSNRYCCAVRRLLDAVSVCDYVLDLIVEFARRVEFAGEDELINREDDCHQRQVPTDENLKQVEHLGGVLHSDETHNHEQ